MELMESGNFFLFSENGNGKIPLFAANGKRMFVFLGRQMRHGKR
jgi:hypothetical protein